MALLGAEYASSDEGSPPPSGVTAAGAQHIVAAPEVSVDVWSHPSLLDEPY